jgi:hypothetical protein
LPAAKNPFLASFRLMSGMYSADSVGKIDLVTTGMIIIYRI